MVIRLFYGSRSVGKVGVRMKLSEVQLIIFDLHRRLVGEGKYLARLSLFSAFCRPVSDGLDDDRLVFFRSADDLDRSCILVFCGYGRSLRLCAVSCHRVVDLRALGCGQRDKLSGFYGSSTLRGGFNVKSLDRRNLRVRSLYAVNDVEGKLEQWVSSRVPVIGTPVAVLGIPFHVRPAFNILNTVEAFSQRGNLPVIIDGAKRHGIM